MLGATLHTLRLRNRLTLQQVADAVGVSKQFIGQIEQNTVIPSPERLAKLATLFREDLEKLNLLAGRLPPDILLTLQQNPSLLVHLRSRQLSPAS